MTKSRQRISPEAVERKQALEAELARILPIIIAKYRPEKIILFGSLATGEVHEWSDIDLVIIKRTELNYFDRLFQFKRLVRSKLATDIFIYQPEEFAARVAENDYFMVDEVLEKGKVIYDSSREMAEVCEG
jgi:predicted nucleotidyltransferase